MNQKFLKVITILMIIATLTMANFLLLCANVVSYAYEAISIDNKTNHKNVEFMAYLKDEKGNKVTSLDVAANNSDLKLYFEISVKQEGYFNGNIVLNNSNFKFKEKVTNNLINKIENNTIYLNQINSGEKHELEVGIELISDEQFDLSLLNMESSISINGVYKNSTQKDIAINAKKTVNLNLVNPYSDEDIMISQEVVTNKILNYSGEDKRVIQVEVKSGLKDNLYPIKNSVINVQVPKISDKYPEKVLVNANDILVANGKSLSQDNWNYNAETQTVNIQIENRADSNKVSWVKNGQDKFIITFIFDKDVQINNNEVNTNSKIELYDNKTTFEGKSKISLNNEDKDSIVTSSIKQKETSIYKGKLSAGISRDITYVNSIDINLNNIANEIKVKENSQTIEGQILNSNYKTTKISKSNLENVLGKGTLTILNAETNEVIKVLNKDTQADENGNIVISYRENVKSILIKINDSENIGKLQIETTKTINANSKEVIEKAKSIEMDVEVSYISNNNEKSIDGTKSNIELKDTETSVDLQINRTELSTMTANDVEFRVVLNSKNENNRLFENPVIKIQLPEKAESINLNSVKLLYEDELKVKSSKSEGNVIEVQLEGKQTHYKEEVIEGAILIINANITTNRKTSSSTEKIVLNYTNGNYQGQVSKDINIVSYAGLVTINRVVDYGVEVVNNEGNKVATLENNADSKKIKIENEIINNEENEILNISILGTFPTKDAVKDENNIEILVSEQVTVEGIDSSRIKVYYTENADATIDLNNNENGWKETITDKSKVKKYLVVVDKLDVTEDMKISYEIEVPEKLEYNLNAKQGYSVFYTSATIEKQVNLNYITLATPKGAVVETTLKGLVAGKEDTEVKENEVLRYLAVVSNTGSEDVSNIKIVANVPDGTKFVNSDNLNSETDIEEIDFVDENKKSVEMVIDNLPQGETVTKYYEVKVDEQMAQNEISNVVTTQYGEVSKLSNEVKTRVAEGGLELQLISSDSVDGIVKSGYPYRFVLGITNHSNEELKNVKTSVNVSELLKIIEIYYINGEDEAVTIENNNEIEIEKIGAGETVELGILASVNIFKSGEEKDVSISAVSSIGDNQYSSNEITLKAKSDLVMEMTVTSENSNSYVKANDVLKYNITIKNVGNNVVTGVTLNNWISNDVTLKKVIRNNEELKEDDYSLTVDTDKNQKLLKITENSISKGETINYTVEVVVNLLFGNKNAVEIINTSLLKVDSFEAASAEVKHILEPQILEDDAGNGDSNNNNTGDTNSPGDIQKPTTYNVISGIAWIDENENGEKDINEKVFEGINVKLLNTSTNEFVKNSEGNVLAVKTSDTGFYSFTKVPKGEYIVIFEYDNVQYGLTTFEKEGVSEDKNSNVITKNIMIDNEDKKVAATEVIKVDGANIANINIGLIAAKKYDLQLDKYISKVTVQNNKTVTNTYENTVLAKQEIDAKQVNSTTVIVEYTIKVTNKGDVPAYVKKIADYISSDYKFSSELNKDWYQSGNDLYCTSLADKKLEPGQTEEVVLTVIKNITESNTGLVNNTAEIVDSYNEYNLTDINSTEGNKQNGENDMGSADLIISIKTGQVVMTAFLVIVTITILGVAIYVLKRIFINGKII